MNKEANNAIQELNMPNKMTKSMANIFYNVEVSLYKALNVEIVLVYFFKSVIFALCNMMRLSLNLSLFTDDVTGTYCVV